MVARTTTTKPAAPKLSATARGTQRTTPRPEVAGDESVFQQAYARYTEAQESLLQFLKAPTWKRTAVALITSIVVACGVGWVAGTLLNWLVVGAVAAAAPMFIVMLTYVVGALLAMYYGGKLAARIGGAVLTGEADERAIAAYDAVKSYASKLNPFGKRELVAAKAR